MSAISAAERTRLETKFPEVFKRSLFKQYGLMVGIALTLAYLVFCWFFFNVGPAFSNGKWDRAAIYVQDWYSWRAQPRLRFGEDGVVAAQWSSRGQYKDNATIDWLTPRDDGSMTAVFDGEGNRLDISTTQVDVYVDGTAYPVAITAEGAFAPDNAPAEIVQDRDKVWVYYGFSGQAEIRDNQVAVQRRFFGWANFLYDPRSPLWGNDLFSTIGLAFSNDEVVEGKANIQLIWEQWLGNQAWQHGDILVKLFQTLVMAFVGTLLATLFAFPLAFFAAR